MSKSNRDLQMADIAALAGVSKSTVSRALADSPLVNDKTKALVRKIAKEKNYRFNSAARNFRTKQTLTVAVIIAAADDVEWTISDPFFLEITAAIAEALDKRGHQLLLTRTRPQQAEWIESFIRNGQADGVIVIGQGSIHKQLNELAAQFDVLSVWGAPVEGGQSYALAGSNNLRGGRLAGEHIAQTGRKRVAFVGYQDHPEIASRFAGVQQGLAKHQLSLESKLVFGSLMDRTTGEQSLEKLVNRRAEYDAVIAASDMQAFKVMSALQSVGVDIPGDIAVIGYDDIPAAAIYHPTLTTIRQDRSAGAELLVENLLKVLNGKGPSCIELEPELVIRESA
ncbi:MAG: substrate-binding domain-containing protein [Halieaceae bacterium]|nr:substrate-binding domain-containing protein [Halieaceae bacterium]